MSSPKAPSAPRDAAKSAAQPPDTRLSQELAPDASFGGIPVVEGEDPAAFQNLLEDVTRAVAPHDFIERIFVRDVVDGTWEILRLRRYKVGVLRAGRRNALQKLFEPLMTGKEAFCAASLWATNDEEGVQYVADMLDGMDLNWDDILAQALELKLEAIERIDRMLHQAETRRNQVLKEIDRHREALAKRMREQLALLEDVETIDAQMALRLSGPVAELHVAVVEERKRREQERTVIDQRQAAPEIEQQVRSVESPAGERARERELPETSATPCSQKLSKGRS